MMYFIQFVQWVVYTICLVGCVEMSTQATLSNDKCTVAPRPITYTLSIISPNFLVWKFRRNG